MKTGAELIAEERQEQIEKHGFDVEKDSSYYQKNELKRAAMYCLTLDNRHYPKNWDSWFMESISRKTLKLSPADFDIEMRKIAGALLAADIDRIQLTQ